MILIGTLGGSKVKVFKIVKENKKKIKKKREFLRKTSFNETIDDFVSL